MILSKKTIGLIKRNGIEIPPVNYFNFPEKVLQFGSGVLLRGLIDYFIDKANKQNVFNGRIVIVKSTDSGDFEAFNRQDNLFTHCIRGTQNANEIEENIINASISRVLPAQTEWNAILECAHNPAIELIVSNTTEIGLALDPHDSIDAVPPRSFPGKLLSFLYNRFKIFEGAADQGMVIIPTELIPGNGNKLKSILKELSQLNNLENAFVEWLEQHNYFCNSLVDRIVPGKLSVEKQKDAESAFGYSDELTIMSEIYCLWAIETSEQKVHDVLSFSKVDEGVVVTDNIEMYRELKLRLLNGSHTFSCGLAHLAGFDTVKHAMADDLFSEYISRLMIQEIVPAIKTEKLTADIAKEFSLKVLDRYRNPYMEHQWLNITLQYTSKMLMRNIPVLLEYFDRFGTVPGHMALGFAAYILFMRSEQSSDGKYYGIVNGKKYLVNDDRAGYLADKWKQPNIEMVVNEILKDKILWKTDLTNLSGLTETVIERLEELLNKGALYTINKLTADKILTE